ncbi:hypothetical protein FRC08_010223 [Ceratobasidium sp. 394]|nr:hypothetical protein FRC08_010223 [Ceratobasidium sp. 394]
MTDLVQSSKDYDVTRELSDAAKYALAADSSTSEGRQELHSECVIVGQSEETKDPWDESNSDDERDCSIQPSRDEVEFGADEGLTFVTPI